MTIKILCPKCRVVNCIEAESGSLTVKCWFCKATICVNGSVRVLPKGDALNIDPRHVV